MSFNASTYVNFVSESSAAQERLFLQYIGPPDDFDIIIVGSGIGGGVLADALADRLGDRKRILVLEAGSFIYPTHVYNLCHFSNASLAKHLAATRFGREEIRARRCSTRPHRPSQDRDHRSPRTAGHPGP